MRQQNISIMRLEPQRAEAVSLADDVRNGFAAHPMELPPKYLYAIGGSNIFEKITELPEYYVTRAEVEALRIASREIVGDGAWSQLIDLGPGSGKKTGYLLEPMLQRGPVTYKPVDLSGDELLSMAEGLVQRY